MVNDLRIHFAIIMYMVGCLALMLYNALVIYRKKSSNKAMTKNTDKWIKAIHQQVTNNNGATAFTTKHTKHLKKKLRHVENLIAFSSALNHVKHEENTELFNKYMTMLVQSEVFYALAIMYKEKKNEERAYFAYFVSQYPQVANNTEGINASTIDLMVSYIEASDIYCRANVLKAFCRIGDMYGIINVLQFFSDNHKFIHHRLLAEDLFNFTGDKEVLALYLWEKYKMWNDNIMLGVITFITMFSDKFKTAFFPVLKNQSTNADIRLAVIRYYKEYVYNQAQPELLEYLSQTENYDFATEAALTLSSYPEHTTTNALMSALQSDNWYVQYNAASSLVALGEYSDNYVDGLSRSNEDAQQIIKYLFEHTLNEKEMNVSEVII